LIKNKNIIFAFLLCIIYTSRPAFVSAQVGYSRTVDSIVNLVSETVISKFDRELSGDTSVILNSQTDTILSRNFTSSYRQLAAQYILEKFQSFGLNARYMVYRSTGKNVIAVKTGNKYPNQKYIICSHYDDMPIGDLAPGADDNASGCCAVLEAARLLSTHNFDYTLEFVTFDEEELGIIGSHAFVDSAFANGDSILGVFNMDMIAYDGNNDNYMEFRTDTNSYPIVIGVFALYQPQFTQIVNINLTHNSDHASFWDRGYKAVLCIENTQDFNPYYHTIYDTYLHVNLPFFLGITKAAVGWLLSAAWDYFINFKHTPITNGYANVPSIASVVVDAHKGVVHGVDAPRLYYRINNGSYNFVNSFYDNLDTFKFAIPGQPTGSTVDYYFAAQDSAGDFVGTLPIGGKGVNPPGLIAPPTQFHYSVITSVIPNSIPVKTSLEQNYPNPFNPSTMINFSLEKQYTVKLIVYDILGREVKEILNNRLNGGNYNVSFSGEGLPSGMYFYTLYLNGSRFETKKMMLIK
jgi:Zn-dependent M28 family amino/carboxypeptidase